MLCSQLPIGFSIAIADQYNLCVGFSELGMHPRQVRCQHVAKTAFGAPVDQQDPPASKVRQGDLFSGQVGKLEIFKSRSNRQPGWAGLRA